MFKLRFMLLVTVTISLLLLSQTAEGLNVVLTNDDGFETDLIQALFTALQDAGHNVIMSAPYEGQSGTAGRIQFLQPLPPTSQASPGGTLPAGSPGVGPTTIADQQFYVAGAVTSAVLYGVDVLAPRFFDGQGPDLVLSGPNEGQNTGLLTPHSGTVGAVVTAINKGIPAIALSAGTEEKNPELIAELTIKLIESAYDSITTGYGLNVNFPDTVNGTVADDYDFSMSKIGLNGLVGLLFYEDLSQCPTAQAVGIQVALPGMCLGSPITSAGYPEDNDPMSEYNIITGDNPKVSVSVIEGTFQGPDADILFEAQESVAPLNIVLTNDDGFETDLIQALFTALVEAGHNVILSAPYEGQSGTGGTIQFLQPLPPTSQASPGGTVPAGSPGVGPTTIAEQQFYVAGAVTSAVLYGVDVLSAQYFNGQTPDLVLSGPNEGQNTGLLSPHSGTVGATVTAINKGIPAIALSAGTEEENPELIAELTIKLINTVYGSIPEGYGLNVNFPDTVNGTVADDHEFAMSKIGLNGLVGLLFYEDLSQCPTAQAVGITVPLPGMCLGSPITSVGYPEDNDPMSEYNIITSEAGKRVSISVIGGTYQAEDAPDIVLPTTVSSDSTPTSSPIAMLPTGSPDESGPVTTPEPTEASPVSSGNTLELLMSLVVASSTLVFVL